MSIGYGNGTNRATDAAREALASPLLDVSMQGAKGLLFNIAGADLTLFEVNNAAEVIKQAVDPAANVIFGVLLDPNMGKTVRLTLIATGFHTNEELNGKNSEAELDKILKGIGDNQLDEPSFSRKTNAFESVRNNFGRRN
jgi:cell division protein FtsZ